MKYKIRIDSILPPEEGKTFERSYTIFEQAVDDLDVRAVIATVNKLPEYPKPEMKECEKRVIPAPEFDGSFEGQQLTKTECRRRNIQRAAAHIQGIP